MKRKKASGILMSLVLFGMFTLTFDIQPVEAESRTWTVDDDGQATSTQYKKQYV